MSGNHNNDSSTGGSTGSGTEGSDALDGVVEGTSGNDSIGLGYIGDPQGDKVDNQDAIQPGIDPDADIIDAGDGDDTVEAGLADDTVFAGSGSDLVYGEEGDDVLYGDGNAPATTTRESFEWDKAPDPNGHGRIDEGDSLSAGFSQDTGNVVVDFSVSSGSDGNSTYTDRTLATDGIVTDGNEIDSTSGMRSLLDSKDDSSSYTLDFSESVENVSFRINDIDHDSVVMIQAFDADGNAIAFDLTGGSDVTLLDTDAVTGNDTADSTGGNTSYYSLDQSVLVDIEGPVGSIVISHLQDGYYSSGIALTDVYFDTGSHCAPGDGIPGDDTLIGGEGDDVIYGEDGDDSLDGGEGDDTIDGGTGENTLIGGDGDDEIIGGDHDDTITGDDGSDTVNGGGGDDVIDTSGSNPLPDLGFPGYGDIPAVAADDDIYDDRDVVHGGSGDDNITTGDDADWIDGGEGDDTINGGIDQDTIHGGDGDDVIVGSEGSDEITGGTGDDLIYGGLDPIFPDGLNIVDDGSVGDPDPVQDNGLDVIDGGDGNDTIYGQDDDDNIAGGAGDDYLDGGIDEDVIEGGTGNDTIIGGQGADTLSGGDDRDTFLGGTHLDEVDGNGGGDDFDTLDLRGLGDVSIIYTSEDEEDGIAVIADTGEVITFEEVESVLTDGEPTGRDGIVEGTFGGDVIDILYDGDPDGDFVDNEDALLPGQVLNDDIIVAKDGDDSIIAALGDDLVFAGGGDDLVDTDEGADTVYGGEGDDYIDGREGDDVLHGQDGDDTLVGGDGDDLATGGEGDDFIATGSGDDTVEAGAGDDYVDGFTGDDLIDGGAGNDGLFGNAGKDTLSGGEGDDYIDAGTDNDEVEGGTGDDTLLGGAGDDTMSGGDGDDRLVSGMGADELYGGADRDTFFVNADSDVTGGETGIDEDTLVVNGPAEVEYVGGDPASEAGTVYFLDGGGDRTGESMEFREIETVVIRDLSDIDGVVEGTDGDDLIDANYVGDPEGDLIDNLDSLDNVTESDFFSGEPNTFVEILGGPVVGDNRDAVAAGDGDDTVLGGIGDDIIYGEAGNDELIGGFGSDDLVGGEGADMLIGNQGVDRMFGGEGDDTLDGGEQTDLMYGGDGDDLFLGGDGNDSIFGQGGNDEIIGGRGGDTIDGGDGDDTIDGGFGDDVIATGAGSNYVDAGLGNNQIIAGDGNDTLIGGAGADRIDGGGGDDSIVGNDGDDSLDGGTGDDTVLGGVGADTVSGGDGSDFVFGGLDEVGDLAMGGDENDVIGVGVNDTVVGGEGGEVDFDTLIAAQLATVNWDNDDPSTESGTVTLYDDDLNVVGTADYSEIERVMAIDLDGTTPTATPTNAPGRSFTENVVEGTDGDDLIDASYAGDPEGDLIDNNDAQDPLTVGSNQDIVVAGAGDDTVFGGEDRDQIFGGEGNDQMYGEAGSDGVSGGLGDDYLDGGAGGDIVVGGEGDDTLSGSNEVAGDTGDILSGNTGDDKFVNVGQGETIDGGEDADGQDNDVLDLTGAAEAANAGGTLSVEYDAADDENGTVTFFDTAGNATGTTAFENIESVVCFTPGTLIATPKGERKVEDLQIGDRVITRDNGIQEIRWLGKKSLTGANVEAARHLRPVLIQKGALGNGLPERDMMVSPNHRILVANDKTALYFEDREVLVAAKHLTGLDGVDVVDVSDVTYIHFMFDQHEVVLSDGAWTESFQPGDHSLEGIGNSQRNEIFELFPELENAEGLKAYQSARRSLKKHEALLLSR